MADRIEIRDGREYRVTVLPEQKPPKHRSRRTRFHYADIGKAGDVSHGNQFKKKGKRRGR